MAEAALEVDRAGFDGVENGLLADEGGSGGLGGAGGGAVRGRDDADAEVGLDGVGEAQAVADDGAVFEGAQAEVEFVFGLGGGVADFGGAEVAAGGRVS